ncbi:unnamed protein product [Peronospora belbahrii]|uniref:No apical meristem-associated C-terminal domain-containing protein n=1 Tax=Peronospora belbahrii TaxID=622444 RepID=A0AAU9LHE9_9STRA|nr:unnamed protein product [Peronospora belbahrii]CAH0518070.1 unnamed protein product [Peronospora belbahrii]
MSSSPASPPASSSRRFSSGSRRQRVLWDSDNVSRGSKTSISVLLEWLMTPRNYERWRDSKSQTGESREVLCSEIKSAMKQHGIHHRENANIRTQINELERSFVAARNWLKENNYDPYSFQCVTDEDETDVFGGPAEAHVLRMCRYYHTLNGVFGHDEDKGVRYRQTFHQKRIGINPVVIKKRNLVIEHDNVQESEPQSELLVKQQRGQETEADNTPQATTAPVAIAPASTTVSGVVSRATIPATELTESCSDPAVVESTQRMLAEAVREERERKRFRMEEERNKLQCEKLRYEVEAAKLKLTIDRVLARKKLFDAGLPEAQVNELLLK